MCRKNQLFGFVQIAFGLGLLIGKCLESGALSTIVGLGIILAGCCTLRSR